MALSKRKLIRLMKTWADIWRSRDGQFYFKIVASNGEIVSVGERYTRKSSAIRGALRAFPKAKIRDYTGAAV